MDQIKQLNVQIQKVTAASELAPLATQLKKAILQLHLLRLTPADFDIATNPNLHTETIPRLLLAREGYELLALSAVRVQNVTLFDQTSTLLQPFYTDFAALLDEEHPSTNQQEITTLTLLYLLSEQDRLRDFHFQVEFLTEQQRESTVIQCILELEQSFVEGSYGKVLTLSKQIEKQFVSGKLFLEHLNNVIRHHIGLSLTASCREYPLERFKSLYGFSDQDIQVLVEKFHWTIQNNTTILTNQNEETLLALKPKTHENVQAAKAAQYTTKEFIVDVIHLAKEAERVV